MARGVVVLGGVVHLSDGAMIEAARLLIATGRDEVPVAVFRDTIQPYPTFSEALFFSVRDLPI